MRAAVFVGPLGLFAAILLTPPDGCRGEGKEVVLAMWEAPTPSIRALEVVSEEEVWYAGALGHYGYTLDAGATWHHDSITDRSFRSLAVTSEAVHLLSITSPALLLRSEDRGAHWDTVFVDADSAAFYDSMVFFDDREGLAMGDPVDSCLRVMATRDGGRSWSVVPCGDLPSPVAGEAGFAASNTNLAVNGDHAWIATGGAAARVFHSTDRGQTWHAVETPMNQGGEMTGSFGMAMAPGGQRGLLVGGDWGDKARAEGSMARTEDGGRTWQALPGIGYRSCVQFDPSDESGNHAVAIGTPGLSMTADGGETWGRSSVSDTLFYTGRYAPSGESVWLAGRGVIGQWFPRLEK